MATNKLKILFFFFGFSLKIPVDLTIKSWFAIWSHIAFLILSVSLIAKTLQQLNTEFDYSFNVLMIFTIGWIYSLSIIDLTCIAAGRKQEALFWECLKKFSKFNNIYIGFDQRTINWKVIKMLICFTTLFLPMFRYLFLDNQKPGNSDLQFVSLILFHTMIIRGFLLKFIYFSGKLELCLKHLELLLSFQILPIQGSRQYKKLWRSCWQMNRLMEDLAGLPIALLYGLGIFGAINNTYTALLGISNEKFEKGAVLSVFVAGLEIAIMSKSCHNCYKYYLSIKGLVHKMHDQFEVESFAMQLIHQKISFAPMQIFRIDHAFVASVSN